MSQIELGNSLDVSFPQVQKYESGVTRISAGRLQEIATVLQAAVGYFFEDGISPINRSKLLVAQAPVPQYVGDFLMSRDGLTLITAFTGIRSAKLRRETSIWSSK